MHQTKKGNQWYFGMKAHIGADTASGLVHGVVGTAANISDISQTHEVLHGKEKTVHADAGYIGVEKRAEIIAGHSGVELCVAAKRGKLKAMPRVGSKTSRLDMRSSRQGCAPWRSTRSTS